MGKCLHKLFKAVVNGINNSLPTLEESGSEVSHFIPEPRNFAEVARLKAEAKKDWLKETSTETENVINNQAFLMDDPSKEYPVTSFMVVYKAKIQSDGSIYKLRLRIVVREDLQNKDMIGDTRSPAASMRDLKYFLEYYSKHKARLHQLDFIVAFLQANVKHRVFVKLDRRYGE